MDTKRPRAPRKRARVRKAGIIKHYLVPGRHNRYRAKLLRAEGAGVTALAVVLLFLGAIGMQNVLSTSASPQVAAVVASSLVDLANGDRVSQGLSPLADNPTLEKAAQLKANDMAANEYFAHVSPGGKDPWYWFSQAGYNFTYAGENLAVYFTDSDAVNTAWMNSPEHRANLLDPNYTQIGIATASGMYQGQETVYVVEEFGTPAAASIAQAPSEGTTPPSAGATRTASAPSHPSTSVAVESAPEVAATPHPSIAGAQSSAGNAPNRVVEETPTSIAVVNAAPSQDIAPQDAGSTLTISNPVSGFVLRIATSPQSDLLIVYELIAFVIVVAIIFELALEVEKRHPRHLVRGFSLLALMGVLMFTGHFVLMGHLLIV